MKAESQSTRSDLLAKAEITTEQFLRTLLFGTADAILVTREPVSVGPRGRWTVASMTGQMPRHWSCFIPSGWPQLDTERGHGGDQTLDVERRAWSDGRASVE
jgi:hypothetical protein